MFESKEGEESQDGRWERMEAKCESLLLLAPPKLSVQEKVSTFKKCINDTTNRKSKKTKSFSEKLK